MADFDNNTAGTWTCSCGKTNTGKFCVNCGAQRPVAPPPPVAARQTEWVCACGKRNTGKFCVKCGSPRPAAMQGKLAGSTVTAPPRNSKPVTANGSEAVAALAAEEAAARKAAEEAAARKAAEEAAARKAAEKAAARKAAEEAAARKAAEEAAARKAAEEAAARKAAEEAAARKAAEEAAARKAAEEAAARKAAEEAAARKAAEEVAARKAAEEAAARKAAEETAVRKAAEEAAKKKEVPAVSAGEVADNNGMMKKVATGAAVLLLLIGAYFMFGKKKETPLVAEPPKVETKAETEKKDNGTAKPEAEKPMDPAVKAEKLKKYAEEMKAANAQKKQDATANEKIVFLVENVQRKGNDLTISGHFYNGKKNRTIISVKAMELDIVLRDVDKELLNEKNIKYTKAFTGMEIKPLQDSPMLTVELPGKAPKDEFNNFAVTAHDVHWEGIGK